MATIRSTRTLFILGLLILSLGYAATAFGLPWTTTNGRIGPGFFPRILGLLLIALVGAALVDALHRDGQRDGEQRGQVSATLGVLALIAVFVPALLVFGALIGMILYTLAALFVFNRGHTVANLLIGFGFPIGLYLMFDTWLNATLPRAALEFIPWP